MSTPRGRVVTGDVQAVAQDAGVALNRSLPLESIGAASETVAPPSSSEEFFYREVQHHRLTPYEQDGTKTMRLTTLIERVAELGTWPENLGRFQGLGRIDAQTPFGPITRNFRFDLPGHSLWEAWDNFDGAARAGGIVAENQLRAEIGQRLQAEAQRVAAVSPAQAAQLLGPDGLRLR